MEAEREVAVNALRIAVHFLLSDGNAAAFAAAGPQPLHPPAPQPGGGQAAAQRDSQIAKSSKQNQHHHRLFAESALCAFLSDLYTSLGFHRLRRLGRPHDPLLPALSIPPIPPALPGVGCVLSAVEAALGLGGHHHHHHPDTTTLHGLRAAVAADADAVLAEVGGGGGGGASAAASPLLHALAPFAAGGAVGGEGGGGGGGGGGDASAASTLLDAVLAECVRREVLKVFHPQPGLAVSLIPAVTAAVHSLHAELFGAAEEGGKGEGDTPTPPPLPHLQRLCLTRVILAFRSGDLIRGATLCLLPLCAAGLLPTEGPPDTLKGLIRQSVTQACAAEKEGAAAAAGLNASPLPLLQAVASSLRRVCCPAWALHALASGGLQQEAFRGAAAAVLRRDPDLGTFPLRALRIAAALPWGGGAMSKYLADTLPRIDPPPPPAPTSPGGARGDTTPSPPPPPSPAARLPLSPGGGRGEMGLGLAEAGWERGWERQLRGLMGGAWMCSASSPDGRLAACLAGMLPVSGEGGGGMRAALMCSAAHALRQAGRVDRATAARCMRLILSAVPLDPPAGSPVEEAVGRIAVLCGMACCGGSGGEDSATTLTSRTARAFFSILEEAVAAQQLLHPPPAPPSTTLTEIPEFIPPPPPHPATPPPEGGGVTAAPATPPAPSAAAAAAAAAAASPTSAGRARRGYASSPSPPSPSSPSAAAAAPRRGGGGGGGGGVRAVLQQQQQQHQHPLVEAVWGCRTVCGVYDALVDFLIGEDGELLGDPRHAPAVAELHLAVSRHADDLWGRTGHTNPEGILPCSVTLSRIAFLSAARRAVGVALTASLGISLSRPAEAPKEGWEPLFAEPNTPFLTPYGAGYAQLPKGASAVRLAAHDLLEPEGFSCPESGTDLDRHLIQHPVDDVREAAMMHLLSVAEEGVGRNDGMGVKALLEHLQQQVEDGGEKLITPGGEDAPLAGGPLVEVCGEAMRHKCNNAAALRIRPGDMSFSHDLASPLHEPFQSILSTLRRAAAAESSEAAVSCVTQRISTISSGKQISPPYIRLLLFYAAFKGFLGEAMPHPHAAAIAGSEAIAESLNLSEKQLRVLHVALDSSVLCKPDVDLDPSGDASSLGVVKMLQGGFEGCEWAEVACGGLCVACAEPNSFLGSMYLDIDKQKGHFLPGDKTGAALVRGGAYKIDCVTQLDESGHIASYARGQPVMSTGSCYLLWGIEFAALSLQLLLFPESFETVWEWVLSPTLHERRFGYQAGMGDLHFCVQQMTERSSAYHYHMGAHTGLSVDEAQRMYVLLLEHMSQSLCDEGSDLMRPVSTSREQAILSEMEVEKVWRRHTQDDRASLCHLDNDSCYTLKLLAAHRAASRHTPLLILPRASAVHRIVEQRAPSEVPPLVRLVSQEPNKCALLGPLLLSVLRFTHMVHSLLSGQLEEVNPQGDPVASEPLLALVGRVRPEEVVRCTEAFVGVKRGWNAYMGRVGPVDYECQAGGINIYMEEESHAEGVANSLGFWVRVDGVGDAAGRNMAAAAVASLTDKYNACLDALESASWGSAAAAHLPVITHAVLDADRPHDLLLSELQGVRDTLRASINERGEVAWGQAEAELVFAAGTMLPKLIPPVLPAFAFAPEVALSHYDIATAVHTMLSSLSGTTPPCAPLPAEQTGVASLGCGGLLRHAQSLAALCLQAHPAAHLPEALASGAAAATSDTSDDLLPQLAAVAHAASYCGCDRDACRELDHPMCAEERAKAHTALLAACDGLGAAWGDTVAPYVSAAAELLASAPGCTAHLDTASSLLEAFEALFMLDPPPEQVAQACRAFQVRHCVQFLQVLAEVSGRCAAAAQQQACGGVAEAEAGAVEPGSQLLCVDLSLQACPEWDLDTTSVAAVCATLGVEVGPACGLPASAGPACAGRGVWVSALPDSPFATLGVRSCVVLCINGASVSTADQFASEAFRAWKRRSVVFTVVRAPTTAMPGSPSGELSP